MADHTQLGAGLLGVSDECSQELDEARQTISMLRGVLEDARDFCMRFDDPDEGEVAMSEAISEALSKSL